VIVPLWWRNACISYDLQQDAGPGIPLDQATSIVDTSFATWGNAPCSTGSPSILPIDLGPVACGNVEYNGDQGNQHVIVFRETWPHDDPYNTLGLTTVTFDTQTGEIYDADTEINASVAPSILQVPLSGGYDFQSIMTHEAGHFLGMAHATDTSATMYYSYNPGSTNMRSLTADDVAGVCTIYPPNGTRTVDPTIDGGTLPEGPCDPTPRHGFSTECGQPLVSSCAMSASGPHSDSLSVWAVGLFGMAASGLVRSRVRRRDS
jgi:MYXO-CTERM domain-containing protein